MKSIAIKGAKDLEQIKPYDGLADRLLFDAKAPPGSDLPGGNGVAFDWTLLDGLECSSPYMLSGGLDPENLKEAVLRSGARAVTSRSNGSRR